MIEKFIKLCEILGVIAIEMFNTFLYYLSISIYPISRLLIILLPYLMVYITIENYKVRGEFVVGIEYLYPVFILLVSYILKSFANKIGKGETPPVPKERFTIEDGEGEVSCEYSRLQEMLLFVNDYEKWLERKGLL